jgi:hypothetical protein
MVEMLSPDEEDATMPSTGIGATGRVVVGWRDGAGRIAFTTMD